MTHLRKIMLEEPQRLNYAETTIKPSSNQRSTTSPHA